MPNSTYQGGSLQFTFKVDAKKDVNPTDLDAMDSVFMELDLNPNSKIYEAEKDPVFEPEKVIAAFEFMINYIRHLSTNKEAIAAQAKKNGSTERIGKIILNKNSPATANIYYLSAYNGDLRPPAGGR